MDFYGEKSGRPAAAFRMGHPPGFTEQTKSANAPIMLPPEPAAVPIKLPPASTAELIKPPPVSATEPIKPPELDEELEEP